MSSRVLRDWRHQGVLLCCSLPHVAWFRQSNRVNKSVWTLSSVLHHRRSDLSFSGHDVWAGSLSWALHHYCTIRTAPPNDASFRRHLLLLSWLIIHTQKQTAASPSPSPQWHCIGTIASYSSSTCPSHRHIIMPSPSCRVIRHLRLTAVEQSTALLLLTTLGHSTLILVHISFLFYCGRCQMIRASARGSSRCIMISEHRHQLPIRPEHDGCTYSQGIHCTTPS